MFKSTDGGQTWVVNKTLAGATKSIATAPSNGSVVYAGTNEGQLYRTSDAGVSWNAVSFPSTSSIIALAVHPKDPEHLFAVANRDGVFESNDGGTSWTRLTGLPEKRWFGGLIFGGPTSESLYVYGEGILVGTPSTGGPDTYAVEGDVKTSSGAPVSSADVIIVHGHNVKETATTDQNGHFSFDTVSQGKYVITVHADGYQISPGLQVLFLTSDTVLSYRASPWLESGFIDLSVSYHAAITAKDRGIYEDILGHFADAIFEMSNGAQRVRTVSIYQSGDGRAQADVVWNAVEWPRAWVSGYTHDNAKIIFGDVFDNNDNEWGYQALESANAQCAGYTLAHEMGHYFYGLKDEYAVDKEDTPVPNSVMNSQWRACTIRAARSALAQFLDPEILQHQQQSALTPIKPAAGRRFHVRLSRIRQNGTRLR